MSTIKKSTAQKYISDLQKNYQKELGQAALDYLKTGLSLFHQYRRMSDYTSPQAALGNLAIATELMLKTFIASKSLALLFKGFPLELRVLWLCPDHLPESFSWRPFDIDVRSARTDAIELGECISVFFLFFPELKQSLEGHFKLLTAYRNASVHLILPSFHRYELQRTAYVALQVHDSIQKTKTLGPVGHHHSNEDKRFLATFKEEQIKSVKQRIDDAKTKSKRLTGRESEDILSQVDYWENYVIRCPICGNNSLLAGDTESRTLADGGEGLDFSPYSFICDACGLELNDTNEMTLAGIPTYIDRSDEYEEYLRDQAQITLYDEFNDRFRKPGSSSQNA